MSLIDTREISKVKIMMVGGGGGSDAATLAGVGKKVSVSGKTVTTDVDLFRAPKEGDRLLVFFDSLVDDPDTMIVYNDGTPVSISLVGEMIPLDYYLNGLCVFQLKTNFITSTPYWDLIERSEGVSYTAGTGIDIINGTIRNTLPQLGDNSQCKSVDSVTQGRLGSYSGDVKYLLIHFDTDAEPYSGAYSLVLSYSGSVAVTKYGALYDRVMSMEYDREIYSGSTLLCEIMDEGTGTQADPVHVDVLGVIGGYVTTGWNRNNALGDRATAEGIGTDASGNYAHAQGYQTTASGNQSTAMGYSTTASADGATAMGNGSTASGANSIAGGYNTTASGAVSTAIGTNTQATQQAQVATGKYNKTNNDAIVMVGNGTGASARSNALEVLLNGDVVAGNEIIDGQGNTLSVLAEALTKTASGNPVVITDCAGGKARSLVTSIEPIQDLHGYDKPWVGGAGDNKFGGEHFADVVKEQFSDAVIDTTAQTVSYLASGISDKILYSDFDANTRYTFMYEMASGSFTNLGVEYTDGTTAEILTSPFVTDSNKSVRYLKGVWHSGETVMKYNKFGVFKGALTADDYTPYSNICPISGRDSVVVTRSDGDEISEDFTIQLGQTVYGADINWDTGVGTVKTAKIDLGTLNYLTATVGGKTFYYADVPNAPQRDYTAISSDYPVTNSESEFFANDSIARAYGTTLYGGFARVGIIDSRYDGYTTAQFKEAMSGVDYEYELATPIELTLTPNELQMLKGYNRVTIESGSIELGYIAKLT